MSLLSARQAAGLVVGALTAVVLGLLAGPATAEVPATDTPGGINLSWDGDSQASSSTESFFGTPVLVPGDSGTRTLLVRNDGPTDGTLRASIVGVQLLDPDAPDMHQGSFYDDLQVGWGSGQASMTQLAENGQTQILQVPLARGEQVPITIDYELPLAATSGNQANVADRLASFDVLLQLGGDLPARAERATGDPAAVTQPPPPAMPETGADLRWPALGVAVLLALGGVLVFAARRREDVRAHH